MTIAQALGEGAQAAIIGLSTVFSVLIILMIVISVMKAVFYKNPNKKASRSRDTVNDMSAALEKAVNELPVNSADSYTIGSRSDNTPAEAEDEDELIAVITAAVAASLNTSTYHLKIKSLRRVDNKQPEWNKAGIHETISHTI